MNTRRDCPVPATSAVEVTDEDGALPRSTGCPRGSRRASAPRRSTSAGRPSGLLRPRRARIAGAACIAATRDATSTTARHDPPAAAGDRGARLHRERAPECGRQHHHGRQELRRHRRRGPRPDGQPPGPAGRPSANRSRRPPLPRRPRARSRTAARRRASRSGAGHAARGALGPVRRPCPAGVSAASASRPTPQATAAPRARRRVRW